MPKAITRAGLLAGFLLLAASALLGQTSAGAIVGVVQDASSAVIPDRPLMRFSHIKSTPEPYGVTAPIPVTKTRR